MQSIEAQPPIPKGQHENMAEAMALADTVTVEFGTADYPLFKAQEGTIHDTHNLYIGVNIDQAQHECLRNMVGEIGGFALLATRTNSAVSVRSLPDVSVDTVFMGNVLGEPDNQRTMQKFHRPDGTYKGNSSLELKATTIRESARILKPLGRLVILETNTPYLKLGSGPRVYSGAIELLETNGFKIVDALDRRDEEWEPTATQFARQDIWWDPRSYVVTAEKPAVRSH